MDSDYFSYLQSQLAALRDDGAPAAGVTTLPPPAPAPAAAPAPAPAPVAPAPVAPSRPAPTMQAPPAPAPPAPPTPAAPQPHYAPPPPQHPLYVRPRQAYAPPPAQRDTRTLQRAIALVAATALVMLATTAWAFSGFIPSRAPGHPSRWDARVLPIVQFVEQQRGLTFKHPVFVDFLAPADFRAKMGGEATASQADRAALDRAVGDARALGLLHGSVDLAALTKQMVEEQVVGVYEPGPRRVYVRGDVLTPDVRVTLAHELTHALQDQYFPMAHQNDPQADDSAARALIEGDAMRIESTYVTQLSPEDRQAYEDAEETGSKQADANTADIPEALTAPFAFPYVFGPGFVSALVAKGGNAAVDAALRHPPKTDAEVIDPQRYIAGIAPLFPKGPSLTDGDRKLEKPSPFGEMATLEMLSSQVGYVRAWQALQGWRGDLSVPFSRSGRQCMAVVTMFDSPDHAAAYSSVANDWALNATQGAVLDNGSSIQVEACDPGPGAAAPPPRHPTALEVLQMRAGLLQSMAKSDRPLPAATASCIADHVIERLGTEDFARLMQSDATSLPASTRQALADAGAACRPGA